MLYLEIDKLTKKYKNNIVLDNLNLQVKSGEITTVLGKPKTGKTTLVKTIAGISKFDSGKIKLFGSNELENQRRKIGLMVEYPVMYISLSIKDNMEIYRRMIGIKDKNIVDKMLKKLSIKNSSKLVKNSSVQLREKMAIAMALMDNSHFIILDEPFDEMDSENIQFISALIEKENKENGRTFLITANNLKGLNDITDKLYILKNGSILEDNNISKLEVRDDD